MGQRQMQPEPEPVQEVNRSNATEEDRTRRTESDISVRNSVRQTNQKRQAANQTKFCFHVTLTLSQEWGKTSMNSYMSGPLSQKDQARRGK